jgi:hypothetical protein
MNLYFHYFSGLKQAGVDALKFVLDYCRKRDIAALFTSQYCDIADDYYRTHLVREADGWRVINEGYLRTVRFKGSVWPDMSRSYGVLGYIHMKGQTYVHLDGSRERKIVCSAVEKRQPHLRQSTFIVDKGRFSADNVTLDCRGFGRAFFSIAGLEPGTCYSAKLADKKGNTIFSKSFQSDVNGTVEVRQILEGPPLPYCLTVMKGER